MNKLDRDFYLRDDVVAVARDLLGKVLCSHVDGHLTKAVITETEAYAGIEDRASHAYGGRRTKRTEPMFQDGGIAYVYLCYGIHHLFNVVTNRRDEPHASLNPSPLSGIDRMLERRGSSTAVDKLLAGPGSLAKGLGIRTVLSGASLSGTEVWIEDHDIAYGDDAVVIGPRIGIDYAGDDAARPYRFMVAA